MFAALVVHLGLERGGALLPKDSSSAFAVVSFSFFLFSILGVWMCVFVYISQRTLAYTYN